MSSAQEQVDQIRETLHTLNTIVEEHLRDNANVDQLDEVRQQVKEAGANLMRLQVLAG